MRRNEKKKYSSRKKSRHHLEQESAGERVAWRGS
jgi:hypothetical protein